jgi:hypothetical protein
MAGTDVKIEIGYASAIENPIPIAISISMG